ncbi:hypothetical protein HY950_01200 [Candidatus Gottesmanbacteria bacterium]|nr:hypothetical protein [Candidatus Gottesmanbacteria bacterium]
MKNRYKLDATIQKQYFHKVETVSKFHPNQLASFFHIVPRSFRDWKRGKYAIPKYVVETIEKRFHVPFPASKKEAQRAWKQIKFNASRRGGLAVMEKYGGPGTPEGRSKGGKRGMQTLRARGLVPQPKPFFGPSNYSPELAEFVGILLGDGHIGKEQWSITLNAIKDKEYAMYVKQLIISLFHFIPSMAIRNDCNVIVLGGSGIRSIQYFVQLGLNIGNKVKQQVGVPVWIIRNSIYSTSCLRGLMDTDGGIFNHTYKVNGKSYTYTKLCFSNRSIPLLRFVYRTLQSSGLTPKLIDKVENKKVWLYNQTEVKQYIDLIGTHNPRLLVNLGGVR